MKVKVSNLEEVFKVMTPLFLFLAGGIFIGEVGMYNIFLKLQLPIDGKTQLDLAIHLLWSFIAMPVFLGCVFVLILFGEWYEKRKSKKKGK